MKFEDLVEHLFLEVPEFKVYYKEIPDPDYYNTFLGYFGLYTREAISHKDKSSVQCLITINSLFNDHSDNKHFANTLTINVLEILTDTKETQLAAVNNFNGECLKTFTELISGHFVNLL